MVTVLTGKNIYERRAKLNSIVADFAKQHGDNGVERVQEKEISAESINQLTTGLSLFAKQRLVIVENLSQNKAAADRLAASIKIVPNEVHIILIEDTIDKRTVFYKTLKQKATVIEFDELDEIAAQKWVQKTIQEEGGSISAGDARLLINAVGVDQLRLSNEIEKLLLYNNKVTNQSIELLVEKNPQETIFQLLESAIAGNKKRALSVIAGLEAAREDPFHTVNMLIWQTHILAVVYSAHGRSDQEIAKTFKINPYVVKKTRSAAMAMSRQQLRLVLESVARLDITLKSKSSDAWRALEASIVSL